MVWMDKPPEEYSDTHGLSRRDIVGPEYAAKNTPDAGPLAYLLPHLNKLGWCVKSGDSLQPLSFQEIMSYPGVRKLLGCEVELIKELSATYCTEAMRGYDAPQPWEPEKG